jgi:hypothetical protein
MISVKVIWSSLHNKRDSREQWRTLSLASIFVQIKGTGGKGTEETSSGWENIVLKSFIWQEKGQRGTRWNTVSGVNLRQFSSISSRLVTKGKGTELKLGQGKFFYKKKSVWKVYGMEWKSRCYLLFQNWGPTSVFCGAMLNKKCGWK